MNDYGYSIEFRYLGVLSEHGSVNIKIKFVLFSAQQLTNYCLEK